MKVLILSPHTDDAEFGSGATIMNYNPNDILWVGFSLCQESLLPGFSNNILYDEFTQVLKDYEVDNYKTFDFPVRRFHEHRQNILEILINIRNEFKPDLVIGPSLNDTHQDHTVIANEMVRAFKNTSIISYELPWNDLISKNNYFVKITPEQLDFKLKVLSNYKSQTAKLRYYSDPDFIRSLATVRGTQINTKYAEAFEIIRWIN